MSNEVYTIPAWRAHEQGYLPTYVDVVDGVPMMPPDTTITPPPREVPVNGYFTVEGKEWVLKYYTGTSYSYEEFKSIVGGRLEVWKREYLDAPFVTNGHVVNLTDKNINLTIFMNHLNKTTEGKPNYLILNDGEYVVIHDEELYKSISKDMLDKIIERKNTISKLEKIFREAVTLPHLHAIVFPEIETIK